MVEFIIDCRADVNLKAPDELCRDTALMLAAANQSLSNVRQLLNCGANVREANKHGCNALHRAQGRPVDREEGTRKAIVSLILERDREALINTGCAAGKTPLHLAAEHGNTPIMGLLLQQGADLEARDCGRRTPLLLAVDCGWPSAVKLLLQWGAIPEVEDLYHRTPLGIARRGGAGGAREILALLDDARKNPTPRRRPTVTGCSPRSQRNGSTSTLVRSPTQTSSIGIMSPTATGPSVFSTPQPDGKEESFGLRLQLPFRTPSVMSAASTTETRGRRAWSVYSRIERVGNEVQ